MFYDYLT